MKLLRPRKRRRCNSNTDSTSTTITTITRSNSKNKTLVNGKIGRRRSKRNEVLTIELRVAKEIVERACVAAAASLDNINNTSSDWDDNDDASVRCNSSNPTETEFFDFVSSAVSRAMEEAVAKRIADANATTKQRSPAKAATNKARRPRKRPRTLESKVEGLEHAESLHTMCSLFPVMATVESLSSPQLLKDPVVLAVPMASAVYDADHPASPKGRELELEACDTIDAASSPESSDHDSLLPPVGTSPTKAPTVDTKTTTTIGEINISAASALQSTPATTPTPRQHQQEQSSTTTAPPPAPRAIDTTNNSTDTRPLAQTPRSRSHSLSLTQNHSHEDDDCDDYDRPIIGVAGDEGSGIERHPSPTKMMIMNGGNDYNDIESKNKNKNNSNNDKDNDAIISLTKVGSVVCRMMGLGIAGHSQLDY